MQRFYQGSMRCKDFLPFLVNTLTTHGWNLADSSGDGKWFVVQKVATTGGIMTFILRENYFPNYGALCAHASLAKTDTVDVNGVYVDAYDSTTKVAKWVLYETYYGRAGAQSVVTWTDWPATLQYYTAAKPDSDDTPIHVFYIISVDVDGFYVKTRGNPAVANNTQNVFYGGVFNRLRPEVDTDNPRGLWGQWYSNSYWSVVSMEPSGLPIVDGSDLRYSAWKRYNIKTHFSIAHPQDSDNNPTLTYDDGYPVSWLYLDNSNNPVIALPLPIVPKGTNLVSENHFLEFNANKYIYLTEGWLPSSTEAVLFKVMDGVKDFQVVNNGSGHEITWLNPNTDVLDKVKLYAKTTGMPTGHDDPDAVIVHTVDNAVANESVVFVDTDPTRYGQTVYYAAFAFDSGTPTPNVSILSSHGSAKISPIIASLPTHVAKLNLSNVAYEFSNDGKINAFYSPTAVYPCNDNTASTDVVDIVSALNGTASANTDTMSTPAKIGSGLNLDGNKYISIPASDRLSFPYSYTLQGWFKRPLAGSNGCLISADGDRSALRINTTTTTAQNVTVVGSAGTSVPSANFPYPLDWSDTDNFHFINLVKKGRTGTIYIDGNLAPIGWTDMSYYDGAFAWNVNSTGGVGGITYIGQQGMAYRFNGAVNDIEFYSYPLSKLQIKYNYNNGNGRMFDPAFYNYAHIDGMAIISDAGAAGERALLPLKGDEFSRNLSGMNALNVDCYSLRAGNIFSIVFINEAGVEFVVPVTITTAKAWETVSLDISGIQNTVKQNIKKIGIRVDNADEVNIISIKNIVKA